MDAVKKVIRPGIKIEIRPEKIDAGVRSEEEGAGEETAAIVDENQKFYSSKITDIDENGVIEAYMPLEQGKLILMPVGGSVDMFCFTVKGIYECRGVVKERYTKEGIYYFLMEVTGDLKKNQRREFYRYKCIVPMEDRLMNATEVRWLLERRRLDVDEELPMDNSTIIDISGGGMQFTGKYRYKTDDIVYCKFNFGKPHSLCVKILKCTGIGDRPTEYRSRAKFIGITNREREEIIKQIFMAERTKI